ncbi:MAG: hypothetical protein GF313_05625 [Caldithrix sp.]|nr:hypothetical protein [Caldithrix sp.]
MPQKVTGFLGLLFIMSLLSCRSDPLGTPAISAEGRYMVYGAIESIINVGDFDKGLFRYNFRTGHETQIIPGSDGVQGYSRPKVSVQGDKLACRYFDGSWLYIYLMDADGSNRLRINKGYDAEFTDDGKFLIYLTSQGLCQFDLQSGEDTLILDQPTTGYNIEVLTL